MTEENPQTIADMECSVCCGGGGCDLVMLVQDDTDKSAPQLEIKEYIKNAWKGTDEEFDNHIKDVMTTLLGVDEELKAVLFQFNVLNGVKFMSERGFAKEVVSQICDRYIEDLTIFIKTEIIGSLTCETALKILQYSYKSWFKDIYENGEIWFRGTQINKKKNKKKNKKGKKNRRRHK